MPAEDGEGGSPGSPPRAASAWAGPRRARRRARGGVEGPAVAEALNPGRRVASLGDCAALAALPPAIAGAAAVGEAAAAWAASTAARWARASVRVMRPKLRVGTPVASGAAAVELEVENADESGVGAEADGVCTVAAGVAAAAAVTARELSASEAAAACAARRAEATASSRARAAARSSAVVLMPLRRATCDARERGSRNR